MRRVLSNGYSKWAMVIGAGTLGVGVGAVCSNYINRYSSPNCSEPTSTGNKSIRIGDAGAKTDTLYPPELAPRAKWNFNWDMREPNVVQLTNRSGEAEPQLPTARRNIILIRHGQYNHQGSDDNLHYLTNLGKEQAKLAGEKLNSTGIKFSSIVSSNMTRAIETAEIIKEQIGQPNLRLEVKDPLLNEGPPCVPEPKYPNPELWNPDLSDFFVEGARIEAAFRKYFHRADSSQEKDSWEIIVCHANVIRYFTMRALQFPPEGWLRISLAHSSLTRITLLPNGDVILKALGDSGHLPFDKGTA